MQLSIGERLILLMLTEIHEKLGIESHDTGLLREAIIGGHHWAIDWKYSGLCPDPVSQYVVQQTLDILDMWSFVEEAWAHFSDEEKERYYNLAGHRSEPRFIGFDEDNESSHLGVARMLIDKLGRFSIFAGRALNSGSVTLGPALRRAHNFSEIRRRLDGRGMTPDEVAGVMNIRS